MNCGKAEEYMMKYLDGTTHDIENAKFKQHTKTCHQCREDFQSMDEIFSVLEEELVEPPEDFELEVMERITEIDAHKEKRRVFVQKASRIVVGVFCAIYIAIIFSMNAEGAFKVGDISLNGGLEKIGTWYGIFIDVLDTAFQASIVLVKKYNYALISLLLVFMVMQKMFQSLLNERNGRFKRIYLNFVKR